MARGFTPKQWRQIKDRDGGCVWHGLACDQDTLVPQHRSGRGMGGDKSKNTLPNGVALCSNFNGLIESDARVAEDARDLGIKLSRHATADQIRAAPVTYPDGSVWVLDDEGNRAKQP